MITSVYITKVRYRYVEEQVLKLFKSLPPELLSFPMDLLGIIKSLKNVKARSYQHMAKIRNLALDEIIDICKSKTGCTHYSIDTDRYLILYNNPFNCKDIVGRILFTLAHELGHIYLEHFNIYNKEMIAEKNFVCNDNQILEKETDYFAALLLAPFPVIKELGITSIIEIQNYFRLSDQSCLICFQQYTKWLNYIHNENWNKEIANLFQPFISKYK